MSIYHHADCMNPETGLPSFPDKHFDLAIVDPPYGIGYAKRKNKTATSAIQYKPKDWDNKPPSAEYFSELMRVSENQIIFGGNYFPLPPSRGFFVWDKCQPEGVDQAMCELIWTSLDVSAKIVRESIQQLQNSRFHPTQKPEPLYRWLLKNYAKQGDLILDTHVGSASSLVVFEEMGFEYVGYELDKDYYRDSTARLERFRAQPKLFTGTEIFKATQGEQGALFEL